MNKLINLLVYFSSQLPTTHSVTSVTVLYRYFAFRQPRLWLATFFLAGFVVSFQAAAQVIPQTELKVVGGLSSRPNYTEVEQPFWNKTIPERSEDRVIAQLKGFDELGIKGPELLKLTSQGVIEFGAVPLSYYFSELPILEAVDIAGLATDMQTARATATALTPVLTHFLSSNYQIKLLGLSPYQPQVFFCNAEVRSLADLRGRTIRVVTRTQAELIEAIGAKSINLPFQDVLSALKNKSITCAVASAYAGFNAKWYSGATHLFVLPVGWNQDMHVVNQKIWDTFAPELQDFLISNIEELVQSMWSFSDSLSKTSYECNTGSKDCKTAPKGQMVLVQPTAADINTVKRIAAQKVLPQWAARCSESCVADFNQTIGKLLKVVVKK